MMKVLWVTTSDTFYNRDGSSNTNSYNGVGWVASQQLELMKRNVCQLAIMFLTNQRDADKRIIDNVTYYPIVDAPGKFEKLRRYYLGCRTSIYQKLKSQIDDAVKDFDPDIIHVFGLECPLSEIAIDNEEKSIVHLQGLLSCYYPSFYPPQIGEKEVKAYGSRLHEYLIRNGFIHAHETMKKGADRERNLFKVFRHFMGRTHWDRAITDLYSSNNAQYHHLDEILRPEFYETTPITPRKIIKKIKITSTISPTIYKGLDLIFKIAHELDLSGFDYEWIVVGIGPDSIYESIVRKSIKIGSAKKIKFAGRKKASEIVNLLHASDIYVHPSYIDNSPNSLCEAQMLGVPIVATNVGGVASLINDGESGFLVPANEPQIAAVRILEIARDINLREKLSRAGYEKAKTRHDRTTITDNLLNIYNQLSGE